MAENSDRFNGYTKRIVREAPFNPENDCVEVEVMTGDRSVYFSNFATPSFIADRLDHYSRTGENVHGAYFFAKPLVIVSRIEEGVAHDVIEDLIKRGHFDDCFEER